MCINVRRDLVPTILLYCITVLLIYSLMFSLIMATYSRNIRIACLRSVLCLNGDFAHFFHLTYEIVKFNVCMKSDIPKVTKLIWKYLIWIINTYFKFVLRINRDFLITTCTSSSRFHFLVAVWMVFKLTSLMSHVPSLHFPQLSI